MKWFSKIDGGEQRPENQKKSNISKILKFAKYFTQKLKFLRNANRGSILIEFAVGLSILIILMFYILDVVKIKRYYSQTKFVGQQMVNVLQNLSEKRNAEGTSLSETDISHAASLAFLTIYPGTTQYSPDKQWNHELRHIPSLTFYYIKGSTGGKAKCIWGKGIRSGTAKTPPWNNSRAIISSDEFSTIKYSSSNTSYSKIYPTLKVDPEKVKIVLEVMLNWDTGCNDSNGNNVSTSREAFGFHFVTPKNYSSSYFNSVITFAPNAGFPKTSPS